MTGNEEVNKLLEIINQNSIDLREMLEMNLTHLNRAARFVEDVKRDERVDFVEMCEVLEDLRLDFTHVSENRLELLHRVRQLYEMR